MISRRRPLLFALAFALGLLLAWSAWPPCCAGNTDSPHARPRPSSPHASRRPATPPQQRPSAQVAAAAKTGIPACDRFVERSITCAQLPDDAKIAIAEASKAWAELAAAGPQPDLEASCRASASVQGDALSAMGC
jgi:hypothetical protein